MKTESILVTGATGILGHHIVGELIDAGYRDIALLIRSGKLNAQLKPYEGKVRVVKGDVVGLSPLQEEIARADYVIHAAATVSFDPKMRDELYRTNVEGTANIVNLCLAEGVKKLIQISSVAAIGRPEKDGIISENTKWSESKYNPYYGVTKYKSELEVWRGYTEGLPVAIINPSIILGQGDYNRSSLKIIKTLDKGISHYPVGSVGMVDARDVALMARVLMESDISGERYIAASRSIPFKELFETIVGHIGGKAPSKPIKPWIAGLAWRLEKIRSLVTGSAPIITKETMATSSYSANYDTSKSRSIPGFEYRDPAETIRWACEGYLKQKQG